MVINGFDYILKLEKENIFSCDHSLPDLNSHFWKTYYQELKSLTGFDLQDKAIHYLSCGLGLAKSDFDKDSDELKMALYEPVSHPRLHFKNFEDLSQSLQDVKDEISEICNHQSTPIITETFDFADITQEKPHTLLWMSSPVAEVKDSFSHYIEGLDTDRRKQARRLMRQYDESGAYRFEFSDTALSNQEIDFVIDNSLKRWGEDGQYYALAQTLWAHISSKTIKGSAYFMRVYEGDDIRLIASYIKRGNTLTSQATCRNEDHLKSGLGTMVDFKTISLLHENKLATILDPTCRTSLNDPVNIGVAKREVVNKDMFRPILVLATQGSDAIQYPHFNALSGIWHSTQDLYVEGRLK